MVSSSAVQVARAALVQTARDFVLLPFWWYSAGLLKMMQWFHESLRSVYAMLGLGVWMKNIFVPMYGDTSFVGRMISFGIRCVVIFIRGMGLLCFSILLLCLFLVYLIVLPCFAIFFLIHVFGVILG